MGAEKDDFLKKLQATFKVEAAEHLRASAKGLLLESDGLTAGRLTETLASITDFANTP